MADRFVLQRLRRSEVRELIEHACHVADITVSQFMTRGTHRPEAVIAKRAVCVVLRKHGWSMPNIVKLGFYGCHSSVFDATNRYANESVLAFAAELEHHLSTVIRPE